MNYAVVFWWLLLLLPVLLIFGVVVGRMSVYARFWRKLKGRARPRLRINGNDFYMVTLVEYEQLRRLNLIEYY